MSGHDERAREWQKPVVAYIEFHGPSGCHECDQDDSDTHAGSDCRCGGPAIDRALTKAMQSLAAEFAAVEAEAQKRVWEGR